MSIGTIVNADTPEEEQAATDALVEYCVGVRIAPPQDREAQIGQLAGLVQAILNVVPFQKPAKDIASRLYDVEGVRVAPLPTGGPCQRCREALHGLEMWSGAPEPIELNALIYLRGQLCTCSSSPSEEDGLAERIEALAHRLDGVAYDLNTSALDEIISELRALLSQGNAP